MIRSFALLLPLAGVAWCGPVLEEKLEHAGARFRVTRVAPDQLQVVWKGQNGIPYRTFDRVQDAFSKQGKTIHFLMNAGIFEPGGIPSGLHIEHGKKLHPLNLADAPGNFFLKPNGVIWIETTDSRKKAFIAPSVTFKKHDEALQYQSSPKVEHAVQSGPILLIDGRRHPAFNKGSSSKLHRNGVGIDAEGRIVFAITDRKQEINLWDFAGLFLKLDCKNALFLDGDLSQSVVNPTEPVESNRFGAMFLIASPGEE